MSNTLRTHFKNQIDGLQNGGKPLVLTIVLTFFVMAVSCVAAFFLSLRGAEQVMMPNVVGKSLPRAMLELQDKELYAKIQLRYSDMPGDTNTILEQEPDAGAIIKAYHRVTLTVSRGVAMDKIEDYVGENVEEVLPRLQTTFSGEASLVTLANPIYQRNARAMGTILAQYPAAGTYITEPLTLQFVVSSGNKTQVVDVPDLQGMTIAQVLSTMQKTDLLFDFTAHEALANEKAGTVVAQEKVGSAVTAYSRIPVTFALATRKEEDRTISGILAATLPDYSTPVPIRLEASDKEGKTTTLVTMAHPGNSLTIPYQVTKGSVLTLYVLDRQLQQVTVE